MNEPELVYTPCRECGVLYHPEDLDDSGWCPECCDLILED